MDMNKMLEQAQKLQQDMENAQKRLESEEVEVSSGGGAVVIKITGSSEFKSVKINEELYKEGKVAVEQAVLAALQEAIKAAKNKHEDAMKHLTSGLDLPGLDDLEGLGDLGVGDAGLGGSGPQPRVNV